MEFAKKDLLALLRCEHINDDLEEIENKLVDHSRLDLCYELVFRFEDKYYYTPYRVRAIEIQDYGPFEGEPDMIECEEVEPHDIVVKEYRPVK